MHGIAHIDHIEDIPRIRSAIIQPVSIYFIRTQIFDNIICRLIFLFICQIIRRRISVHISHESEPLRFICLAELIVS